MRWCTRATRPSPAAAAHASDGGRRRRCTAARPRAPSARPVRPPLLIGAGMSGPSRRSRRTYRCRGGRPRQTRPPTCACTPRSRPRPEAPPSRYTSSSRVDLAPPSAAGLWSRSDISPAKAPLSVQKCFVKHRSARYWKCYNLRDDRVFFDFSVTTGVDSLDSYFFVMLIALRYAS